MFTKIICKHSNAFTLVELMIVIAIISILSSQLQFQTLSI
jgi:prepilin-type N-terminal cleavage/methylation domain-containing protein